MIHRIKLPLVLVLLTFPFIGMAFDRSEINHLLNFVESTHCSYERNGDHHNGKAAADHIRKKYKYYYDKINNTEDFIAYSATKSTFSGKYYKIHCQGQPVINSREWLLLELNAYRSKSKEG